MPKGRRYDSEPKLNLKKVFGVLIAFIVLIMIIVSIVKILKNDTNTNVGVTSQYFSVYKDGRWGVINQDGDIVIPTTYDEMVIVPNSKTAIFICTYDVDDEENTYKTKAINEAGQELFTTYEQVEAIDNYDSKQNIWFEDNVLRVKKDNKYGVIDFNRKFTCSM